MALHPVYRFSWTAAKAESNRIKHGVDFATATDVFRDPLAVTIFDADHSETEDRWVTLGQTEDGLLVVVHTLRETQPDMLDVHVISARRATTKERRQYEEGAE